MTAIGLSRRVVGGALLAALAAPRSAFGQDGEADEFRADQTTDRVHRSTVPVFINGGARYVARTELDGYPLIAIAGISQEERFAAFRKAQRRYEQSATLGSIGLFFFAMVATLLSARLAWRKHQEAEVQDAYRVATEG